MFNIFAASRTALITLVISSPVAAFAQTPRDIANLVWQHNVPASISAAPSSSSGFAGAARAADLARVLQTNNVSAHDSNAPASQAVFATAFGAQDLARLNGAATQSVQSLFATTKSGIIVADSVRR
jgi:hypothetical protein